MKKLVRISLNKTSTEKFDNFDKNSKDLTFNTQANNRHTPNLLRQRFSMLCFSLLSLAFTMQAAPTLVRSAIPMETNSALKQQTTVLELDKTYTVKGIVLDEENIPLAGVSIVLKGTANGTSTDLDGKFEFPIALEPNAILVFSYLGYETKEYVVKESNTDVIDITITFETSDVELMGAVNVEGVYKTKPTIFQKFIALFK